MNSNTTVSPPKADLPSDAVFLLSGGTGSFGSSVLKRLLEQNVKEIRIFSRDEKKQDDLRKKHSSRRLKFYLGDVRDRSSINNAINGVDFVFHAAALKQVPSCEFHPIEAVKTNILGTENLLDAAIDAGVSKIVCLSTDKAVYPINAMGISKAMMEKVFIAKSRLADSEKTVICGTRYGNVMASRGSVIPLFASQVMSNTPITITDPNMTRFMMTLDEAVELVLYAFANAGPGDIFVQKSPAASILTLAQALTHLLGRPDHPIITIGTRHGEKAHETLLSREEMANALDLGAYFKIPPDLRDLNYEKYIDTGESRISEATDYTSANTIQLDVQQMEQLLMRISFIQDLIAGKEATPNE
jgi:UDP-N-acetylglucosamine 4,6-dehydratase